MSVRYCSSNFNSLLIKRQCIICKLLADIVVFYSMGIPSLLGAIQLLDLEIERGYLTVKYVAVLALHA